MQRLELTWIGKNNEPRLEPRILLENPEHRSGQADANGDWQGMLIHGDNLLALKALEQDYSGKVKCIYIDPPYNTGSAFEHYDDDKPHSDWLSLIRDRIVILKRLLSPDGFLCCQIDDSEGQYLKVLLDEIFGRNNYLTTFYVRVRYPDKTLKQDMDFHKEIEQIHIYRKEWGAKPNKSGVDFSFDKFCFYIKELENGQELEIGGKKVEIFQKGQYQIIEGEGSEFGLKEIWATGSILDGNSSGRFFRDYLTGRYESDGLGVIYKVYGIGDDRFDFRYFTGPNREGATKGKYFQGVPKEKLKDEVSQSFAPINNFYDLAANFGNCRSEGGVDFRSGKKPEMLLEMILFHFSSPGDLILDSFLGSGTTAAVAHKMGRRWIGIELGEHAHTHCLPRLRKIVHGEDQGGISKAVGWQGGGGFRYYNLAPSLLLQDPYGQWVISQDYDAQMLAAAVAKHEGFRYDPDAAVWWKQSRSSERDWLLVTTQYVNRPLLDSIHESMAEGDTLLICCKAFDKNCAALHPGITLKKIPNLLVNRCEYGRDDYSLHIVNVPIDAPEADDWLPEPGTEEPTGFGRKIAKQSPDTQQGKLF